MRPKPARKYQPPVDERAPEHRMCLTCDYHYLGLKCPQCASLSYVAIDSGLAL
jgi:hypothetical protein